MSLSNPAIKTFAQGGGIGHKSLPILFTIGNFFPTDAVKTALNIKKEGHHGRVC
jgi:hypothetical protein